MIKYENNYLKYRGRDVQIRPLVKIVNPHVIEIDDYSMIDDFTFIDGGTGTQIGKYVRIGCFTSIVGGGELIIEDYANIGHGVKIITDSESRHTNAEDAPARENKLAGEGKIRIGKGAVIGSDVIISPNITIGEGAVVGSCTHVAKDIDPWSVNACD